MKRLTCKRFSFVVVGIIASYVLYHSIVWFGWTGKIFDRKDGLYVGDLGRMSYQTHSLVPRKLEYTLPKQHLGAQTWHGQKIDMLTLGDSFSNAATGGKNPYYQDYLASYYDLNIVNLKRISKVNPIDFIMQLHSAGKLEELRPRFILIQGVQRMFIGRFARSFDFSQQTHPLAEDWIQPTKTEDSHIPSLLFVNTANYKLPYYSLSYHFNPRAKKDIVKMPLVRSFFSNPAYEKDLLFTYEDIKGIDNDFEKVQTINANFNLLATFLQPLGITLIVMPAVDKYTLYAHYIPNNPFPQSTLFEALDSLEKNYVFINTKSILSDLLAKGTMDVFYADDTHWSYIASDAIAQSKIFRKILEK